MDIIQMKEKVAKDLELSYEEVDEVIDWVYGYSRQMTAKVKEIEFSGFGKILVSQGKTKKIAEKVGKSLEKNVPGKKEILDDMLTKLNNKL